MEFVQKKLKHNLNMFIVSVSLSVVKVFKSSIF